MNLHFYWFTIELKILYLSFNAMPALALFNYVAYLAAFNQFTSKTRVFKI